MKRTLLLGLFLLAGVSNGALASADLAKAKNCMACHSVNNKVLGPAFKDIGAICRTKRRGRQAGTKSDEGWQRCVGHGTDAGQCSSKRGRSAYSGQMDTDTEISVVKMHDAK